MVLKVVRPCVKTAKILRKERPTFACIIDVLRGICSWTEFPEDGISGRRMVSGL